MGVYNSCMFPPHYMYICKYTFSVNQGKTAIAFNLKVCTDGEK